MNTYNISIKYRLYSSILLKYTPIKKNHFVIIWNKKLTVEGKSLEIKGITRIYRFLNRKSNSACLKPNSHFKKPNFLFVAAFIEREEYSNRR